MSINAVSAGIIAAGVVAGTGAAFASRSVFEGVMERSRDKGYAEWNKGREQLEPGEMTALPQIGLGEDEQLAVLGPVIGGGALGLWIGGDALGGLLTEAGKAPKGRIGASIAFGVGAAILGTVVGGIVGGTKGAGASHARNGIDINRQAAALIENYDSDADKSLDIADDDRQRPEYLRKQVTHYYNALEPVVNWVSIERAAKKADANGDDKVDVGELKTLLEAYDANGDGLISEYDARDFRNDDLETIALWEIG